MKNKPRILVTGNIPPVPAGERDVVDKLGEALGITVDNVMHITGHGRYKKNRLKYLQSMPSYVASVSMRDIEQVLPTATDVIIFKSNHDDDSRNTIADQVAKAAVRQGLDPLVTTSSQEELADRISEIVAGSRQLAEAE